MDTMALEFQEVVVDISTKKPRIKAQLAHENDEEEWIPWE